MKEEDKDILRAKWFEGAAADDLFGQEELDELNAIKKATGDMTIPEMDESAVFNRIEGQIKAQKNKIFSLRRMMVSAAAALILLFAFDMIMSNGQSVESGVGQSIAHILPDDSEVLLNGNSKLTFNKNFEEERELRLKGEAFFEVTKGQKFTVLTDHGSVQVLGTSFNVFARGGILNVSCKTGKVMVTRGSESHLLTTGKAVRLNGRSPGVATSVDTSKIGTWQNGTSQFTNASLAEVISSLQSVYDIEIDLPSNIKDEQFTGSFVHDDLTKACKMIFDPMQIKYQIDNGRRISIVH